MTFGMIRCKNEARWIRRCIESILPLCDMVYVLDDHSTDGTPQICAEIPKTHVWNSAFEGLDESRDKNWLLEKIEERRGRPDWIIAIDGDEILVESGAQVLRQSMDSTPYPCISLPVWYLWDREDQRRMDGVYGDFRRESVFRPDGSPFVSTGHGGNFHCGNVPLQIRQKRAYLDAPLLHLGYLHREDRIRKLAWYREKDPNNGAEDNYRHVAQGDLPEIPADIQLMHAGPLRLETL